MRRRPPRSTLFPDTTLFRSHTGKRERPPPGDRLSRLIFDEFSLDAAGEAGGEPLRSPTSHPQSSGILPQRSEETTSELQSRPYLVCRPLLAKNNPPAPPCPP